MHALNHYFLFLHVSYIIINLGDRSRLVQRVGIDDIAESMAAFGTNYSDTGLFGVYATSKVYTYLIYIYNLINSL